MWWTAGSGRINLELTKKQAQSATHPGPCDADVAALSRHPAIARQLHALDPDTLRAELREYGAWDAAELADHAQNLQRVLWVAAGDIADSNR